MQEKLIPHDLVTACYVVVSTYYILLAEKMPSTCWEELGNGEQMQFDDYSFHSTNAYMHSLHSVGVWGKQVLFSKMTLSGSLLPQHSEAPEPAITKD